MINFNHHGTEREHLAAKKIENFIKVNITSKKQFDRNSRIPSDSLGINSKVGQIVAVKIRLWQNLVNKNINRTQK